MDDFGVVEYQQAVGRQQFWNVEELALGDVPVLVDKQFGVVALLKREFGYTVIGQGVVVVGYGDRFRVIVHGRRACVGLEVRRVYTIG